MYMSNLAFNNLTQIKSKLKPKIKIKTLKRLVLNETAQIDHGSADSEQAERDRGFKKKCSLN